MAGQLLLTDNFRR